MPEVIQRHELECDEDTFWTHCFFDPEYSNRLYREYLKFPGYEITSQSDVGGKSVRTVRVEPPVGSLPGPIKKVVGDRFGYVEEGTFDKATKRYSFVIQPTVLADKTKCFGECYCEKIGDKKVVRVLKLNCTVKMFGLGGMLEDRILQDFKSQNDKSATFTNQYLKEKNL